MINLLQVRFDHAALGASGARCCRYQRVADKGTPIFIGKYFYLPQ
jgi:hypothetical protein